MLTCVAGCPVMMACRLALLTTDAPTPISLSPAGAVRENVPETGLLAFSAMLLSPRVNPLLSVTDAEGSAKPLMVMVAAAVLVPPLPSLMV